MTVEADIIEALQASQSALQVVLTEMSRTRADNAALGARIAAMETTLAALETRAVNVVEPSVLQPTLDALARAVAESLAVLSGAPALASEGWNSRQIAITSPDSQEAAISPGEGHQRRSSALGWV